MKGSTPHCKRIIYVERGSMKVGRSVQKAIDEWTLNDFESAMLHACNAVDGTAKKTYPQSKVGERFRTLLRESYFILGPMAAPGIDLASTFFPVETDAGKKPLDLADVIYSVHRCSHGHGDELPYGFELIPEAGKKHRVTTIVVKNGTVRLSDRVIFGLLAVAVLAPYNVGQSVPIGYHLTYGDIRLEIGEWWGRSADFRDIVARDPPLAVKLDFGDWLDPT